MGRAHGFFFRHGNRIGKGLLGIGLVLSGLNILDVYNEGGLNSMGQAIIREAGGWTGAYFGAMAGAAFGTMIFPGLGTLVGGFVGAVGGAIFGEQFVDWMLESLVNAPTFAAGSKWDEVGLNAGEFSYR